MAFVFDHLIAFLVGATLLGGLLFLQQRNGQTSVESAIRYQTEAQAVSFVETLTRDLENARTRDQAKAALGEYEADVLGGPTQRALSLHQSSGQTDWIQFVTLATPEDDTDSDASTRSKLIAVAYRMEPTGQQISARGQIRNLHQIVRYVYDGTGGWTPRGGSPATVVGFTTTAYPGGTNARLASLPPRIDFAVELAHQTPGRKANDQLERAEVGLTRQGATARVYASGTGGWATPPSQGSLRVPRLPWVGPAPTGTTGGTTGGTTSPGSTSPGTPVTMTPILVDSTFSGSL